MSKDKEQLLFNQINIIGLGLMGGSIAKACKQYNIAKNIYGFDNDQAAIDFAIANKIIDQKFSFRSELTTNNLTIIASPLSSYVAILSRLKSKINTNIIIDIGSLKLCVIDWAKDILGNKASNFIACHPIAGSDKFGIVNSCGSLFVGKKAIISKIKDNQQNHLNKIKLFWQKIGCYVDFIDATEHDKIFSLVSHLPQFLAFIARDNYQNGVDEVLDRHFRLQNSNLRIWQEIFVLNKLNIKHYLGHYLKNIDLIIEKLYKNQYQYVFELLRSFQNNTLTTLNKEKDIIFASLVEFGHISECDFNDQHNRFGQLSPTTQKLLIKRIFLVWCFLDLPDIKNFQIHSGSGFKDFIAVIFYLKYYLQNPKILEDNQTSLIEFLNQIKSKIIHYNLKYEFK